MNKYGELEYWLRRDGANCQKHVDCADAIVALQTQLTEANERADELGADKGTYFRLYEQACIRMTQLQTEAELWRNRAKGFVDLSEVP